MGDVFVDREHRINTEPDRSETRSMPLPRPPQGITVAACAFLTIVMAACASTETSATPEAELIVTEGVVSVNGSEISTGEIERIQPNDEISLQEGARGFLTRDEFVFELFKGTAMRLEGLEGTELTAFLDGGHLHFRFEGDTDARLRLETTSSVLTTLGTDTEFTVCQPPTGNTCMAVQNGAVELESAGKAQTYVKGEGTFTRAAFVTMGEPPGAAICIPHTEFDEWFERARLNEDSPPLGALVGEWQACGTAVHTASAKVPGTEPWSDTGVEVKSGDTLMVEAGGAIAHFEGGELVDPDGDPGSDLRQYNLVELPDTNHAALIGRIGEDGAPFLVGRSYEAVIEIEGRLFLGINDGGLNNNAGEFFAAITVISP